MEGIGKVEKQLLEKTMLALTNVQENDQVKLKLYKSLFMYLNDHCH